MGCADTVTVQQTDLIPARWASRILPQLQIKLTPAPNASRAHTFHYLGVQSVRISGYHSSDSRLPDLQRLAGLLARLRYLKRFEVASTFHLPALAASIANAPSSIRSASMGWDLHGLPLYDSSLSFLSSMPRTPYERFA